jgi:hypothetical protein
MASITPNSDKRRKEERRTAQAAGRLAREIGNSAKARSPQIQRMRHQLQDLLRTAQRTGDRKKVTELRQILQRMLGNVTARAARLAMDQALGKAGPGGRALKRIVGKRLPAGERDLEGAIKRDMEAASSLIATMQSPTALPPQQRTERPQVSPVQPRESGGPMPYNTRMLPNGKIEVKTGSFHRVYSPTDPIITGKWIRVQSSNVRAISFNFSFKFPHKSTLYVQFLGTDAAGNRAGHGPMYEYYDIPPDKFDSFRKTASKGGWIWDELRVRGSAVQHRVKYTIRGTVGGYVPRRATVRNGREMFVKRTIQHRAKLGEKAPKPLTSPLPEQDLGPARGRPRRGRPKRGRGPRLF